MFCVRAVDGKPPQAIALAAPTCEHPLIVEGSGECVWCSPHSGDVLAVVDTCPTCHGQREKISASGGYWLNGRVIRTTGGQTFTNVRCHACRADDEPTGLLVSGYVTAEAMPVFALGQDPPPGVDKWVPHVAPFHGKPDEFVVWRVKQKENLDSYWALDCDNPVLDAVPGGTALLLAPITAMPHPDACTPGCSIELDGTTWLMTLDGEWRDLGLAVGSPVRVEWITEQLGRIA